VRFRKKLALPSPEASNPFQEADVDASIGLGNQTVAVSNTRHISKRDLKLNDLMPKIEVDPEIYEVKAGGELLTLICLIVQWANL